jgi:hypothetical protein
MDKNDTIQIELVKKLENSKRKIFRRKLSTQVQPNSRRKK